MSPKLMVLKNFDERTVAIKAVPATPIAMQTKTTTSCKICRVLGTTLKAIKKGTCRVVVRVKGRTRKNQAAI